ncbi:MAG: hypothetical protein MUF72_04585 [Elainella sp. Prado103]|nr:hypothetical protein [Elainella sp. Prado103]
MPDSHPTANRLLALEQELLAQRQRALGFNIAAHPHPPTSHNRLLALEQSLQFRSQSQPLQSQPLQSQPLQSQPPQSQPLQSQQPQPREGQAWAEANTWHQLAASLQRSRPPRNSKRDSNHQRQGAIHNRLLALEQSLEGRSTQFSPEYHSTSNGHHPRYSQSSSHSSSHSSEHHPRSRVIAQAFDFNEAIELQYHPTAFSIESQAHQTLTPPGIAPSPPADSPAPTLPLPAAPMPNSSTSLPTSSLTSSPTSSQIISPSTISPSTISPSIEPSIHPPPVSSSATQFSNAHSVFDQLGKTLTYATAFDLGTLPLSLQQRFDEFDRRLDEQDTPPPQRPYP